MHGLELYEAPVTVPFALAPLYDVVALLLLVDITDSHTAFFLTISNHLLLEVILFSSFTPSGIRPGFISRPLL